MSPMVPLLFMAVSSKFLITALNQSPTLATQKPEPKGAFFWGYSGYSYSGLGITEYTEFQFRKERSYMFQIWKRNRR